MGKKETVRVRVVENYSSLIPVGPQFRLYAKYSFYRGHGRMTNRGTSWGKVDSSGLGLQKITCTSN